MATKESVPDTRKGARFDVSLPMRFTEDGENFSEGVVTSLSSIGLFVQTQRVPGLGSSVWFDLGLGGALPPIRGRAKVGTLNRRFGTDVVTGFGIEFESPRDDIAEALNQLEPQYPGAVRLETQGNLVWPIANDPDRPDAGHEGDGLRIGCQGAWVGAGGERGTDAPAVAVGPALNRPIRDFLDMIRDLNSQILTCDTERIPFAYQGRVLGPSSGVYKSTLVAGLIALDREEDEERRERAATDRAPTEAAEPAATLVATVTASDDTGEWTLDLADLDTMPESPVVEPEPVDAEPEPVAEAQPDVAAPARERPADPEGMRGRVLLDLVAAQMRIVDDLACGGWRLEHMWAEQLASIEQGCALLQASTERLAEVGRATDATSGEATRELMSDSLRGLDAVKSFMERVLWNARAFTPSEEVFRAYDDFVDGEREAKAEARPKDTGKKRLFDESVPHTTTVRIRSRTPPWKIALAVVLVGAAGATAYWSVRSSRKILDSAKVHAPTTITLDTIEQAYVDANIETRMTLDGIAAEGSAVRVTVPADWPYKPKAVRLHEFETLVGLLADKGFISAVAVTSEGIERASWVKGVVSVVD